MSVMSDTGDMNSMNDRKEIVKSKPKDLEEYEELLLRRDKLKKEARIYRALYVEKFGDHMLRLFEKKIECIKLKKKLAFCQAAVNSGKRIDITAMEAFLKREMREYNEKLAEMARENENAHNMERIDGQTLNEIKRLYRKLARMIHPDLNPKTNMISQLKDLWHMIALAYNANDLEELRECELLVAKILSDNGIETDIDIAPKNLSEKIEKLKNEIHKIKTTEPYRYKYLLRDEEEIAAKIKELKEELAEYEEYEKKLIELMQLFGNEQETSGKAETHVYLS